MAWGLKAWLWTWICDLYARWTPIPNIFSRKKEKKKLPIASAMQPHCQQHLMNDKVHHMGFFHLHNNLYSWSLCSGWWLSQPSNAGYPQSTPSVLNNSLRYSSMRRDDWSAIRFVVKVTNCCDRRLTIHWTHHPLLVRYLAPLPQ